MSKHNKGNGIYFETESTTGWIFNKPFIPTGRIKRMRNTIPKHRCPSIYKRIGRKRYITILNMNGIVFEKTMFGITRWNRH